MSPLETMTVMFAMIWLADPERHVKSWGAYVLLALILGAWILGYR
jgi:hypothetical protein